MTESTDQTLASLMRAAQQGDERAYQALLRGCIPLAQAVIRRVGVPAERVDDTVQEVLLTLHRARATYDPARPFLPWMRAIAQRRAIDALRLHGRTTSREVFDEQAYLSHPGTETDADEALGEADAARRLRDAIATLPPGQRQAIELLGLRERSLEQAAGDTGRTKGALKVNLHRAIAALRQRLTGEKNDA